jgi:hypothetical protein
MTVSGEGDNQPKTDLNAWLPARLAARDRFPHALVTLDHVSVLPEELVPEGAVEVARAYLEELRADALIARLETVVRPAVHEAT